MNKKYLSAFVCGFGASVLTTIPGLDSIACCLLIPVASVFSVGLYKKSQPSLPKIQTKTGVMLGLFTGLFAAFFASSFEIIFTYITKSNELIVGMPQTEGLIRKMNLGPAAEDSLRILKQMVVEIQTTGFSTLFTLLITAVNLLTYSIFGMLGGVLGAIIINRRTKTFN